MCRACTSVSCGWGSGVRCTCSYDSSLLHSVCASAVAIFHDQRPACRGFPVVFPVCVCSVCICVGMYTGACHVHAGRPDVRYLARLCCAYVQCRRPTCTWHAYAHTWSCCATPQHRLSISTYMLHVRIGAVCSCDIIVRSSITLYIHIHAACVDRCRMFM